MVTAEASGEVRLVRLDGDGHERRAEEVGARFGARPSLWVEAYVTDPVAEALHRQLPS